MPPKRKMSSQRQWRWAFANRMPFARRWARNTTGTSKRGTKRGQRAFRNLPTKKHRVKRRKT